MDIKKVAMKNNLLLAFLTASCSCFAQDDTTILRAFPITDYMVPLDDTTTVVQLEMPEGLKLKDNQLGLVYGTYKKSSEDAVQKGYGRCYLIKSNYHYFAISHNESGKQLAKGDLVYTFMPKQKDIYYGRITGLAGHFIRLKNVHGEYFFDRYQVFLKWTERDEQDLVDSLVADIRFTGSYFLNNQPEMNVRVTSGRYEGGDVLELMAECQPGTVKDFLDYVNARARMYAGCEWKVSEIFATWLKEGAPEVKK